MNEYTVANKKGLGRSLRDYRIQRPMKGCLPTNIVRHSKINFTRQELSGDPCKILDYRHECEPTFDQPTTFG